MESPSSVADQIVSLIRATPSKTILGVRLGFQIKQAFPFFVPREHQCKNLRQFINRYVSQVEERGSSGADIVYGLRENDGGAASPMAVEASPQQQTLPLFSDSPYLPPSSFVWKAFSNPTFRFSLYVNSETGEQRAMPDSAVIGAPWVCIPSATPDEHLQIAKDFVATLPDARQGPLLKVLEEPLWWHRFFDVAQQLGVGATWGSFRRRKLQSQLQAAIERAAPEKHATALRVPAVRVPTLPDKPAAGTPVALSEEEVLRRAIQKVVSTLSLAELRSLKFPVGNVMDALRNI